MHLRAPGWSAFALDWLLPTLMGYVALAATESVFVGGLAAAASSIWVVERSFAPVDVSSVNVAKGNRA